MSFSQEQRVFIVEHYFSSRSYARVVDEFRRNYPDVTVPNNSTITRLIARFSECESVADKKRTGRPAILTPAKLAETRADFCLNLFVEAESGLAHFAKFQK
ncbi:hypothetical protein ANN_03563 [Periplaneta americana]|uniref:DUF4817 domain-containing protein n=1 Tax=Periplaneta americana TaxID=6978 RepID=A0ABQ8U172_PERAM|nr:hypothetical protein ANN_03563 [Periplaneta americana]